MTLRAPRPAAFAVCTAAASALGCGHAAPRAEATSVGAGSGAAATAPAAADDGLAVTGTIGTVPQEKVQDTFARRRPAIEACFRGALDAHPWLGGRLGIKVRLGARGEVQSAWLVDALGQLDVERCVLDLVRATTFAAPEGGESAEFAWGLDLRGTQGTDPWSCDKVAHAFSAHHAALDRCLHGSPPQPLTVVLFVAPGGVVSAASAAADEPLSDAARDCVAGEVRLWKFPDPHGKVARAACRYDNGALVP